METISEKNEELNDMRPATLGDIKVLDCRIEDYFQRTQNEINDLKRTVSSLEFEISNIEVLIQQIIATVS